MKTYQIEVVRSSYEIVTVEAENEDQAEQLAWKQIERGETWGGGDAAWEIANIEEVTA
jgi:hypothetical protein